MHGAAPKNLFPLESVLRTHELKTRPSQPSDFQTECQALNALVQTLAESPHDILQRLVDIVLDMFKAGSAGISLMKENGGTAGDFYWPAVAGGLKGYLGSGTPRFFGPCGVVIDSNEVQLFIHPEKYYDYLAPITPVVCEVLLAPFSVNGKPVGTVWLVSHDDARKFNSEEQRLLASVSKFAGAAYQIWTALESKSSELNAIKQLQSISAISLRQFDARALHEKILETAVNLLGADSASLQIVDSNSGGALHFQAHRNMTPEAIKFWEHVSAGNSSPSGYARLSGTRTVVIDVETSDLIHGASLEYFRKSGIRSMQSTPLLSRGGELLGTLSTHWKIPHNPPERDLRFFDLLVRQASDLIEHRQAEEQLRIRNEEFSCHFNLSTVGNVQADPQTGRLLLVNKGVSDITGFTEAELLKMTYLDITHPDDRAENKRRYESMTGGESDFHKYVRRLVRKDGEVRWVSVNAAVSQRDADGKPLRTAAVLIDITDRIRAETAERDIAAKLADQSRVVDRVLSSIDDFVYTFDLNARFTYANKPLLENWGLTWEQAIGRSVFELNYTPDLATTLSLQIQNVINTGTKVVDETPNVNAAGKHGHYQYIFTPIFDEAGKVVAVAGTTRDITERKQAERALKTSEERYRTLFNAMDEAFCVIEMIYDSNDKASDYRFIEVNPAFEKHTGLSNATGRRIKDLAPDLEDNWIDTYATIARTGDRKRFINVASSLRGRWFDVYAFRLGGPGSRKVAIFFSDITERQRHEEALRNADRRKDEFLAVISHELRTPLTAMVGWIKMLRGKQVPAEKVDYGLQVIERNVKVQTQLIEDLLDISRIITGKMQLDVKALDLKTALEAAIETVRPAIEAKKIILDTRIESIIIRGDQNRLQQIFWNLLTNAIKFTPTGGNVDVSVHSEDARARIMIRDTGQGIKDEFLPLIFNRFQQADVGITRNFGGLGLGLSIVRHLVELHGGTIKVESEGPQKGSTFTLELPMPVFASTTNPIIATPLPDPSKRLSGMNILVLDDEADTRDLLSFVLRLDGAQVITATNVVEAIEHFRNVKPDVIVSDISMAEEDGYSFIRRIRTFEKTMTTRTPAMALTAFAREEDRLKILNSGFDAYASKPIEPNSFVLKILQIKGTAAV